MGKANSMGRKPARKRRMAPTKYIELTFRFAQESGKWTAECVELGTATYGDTFEQAKEAIADMVQLHLDALEQVDAADAFFRKHRITVHHGQPRTTANVSVRSGELVERFSAPMAGACC